MSGEAAGERAPDQGAPPAAAKTGMIAGLIQVLRNAGAGEGVWVTFRQTPPATKAILVGMFVNSLAGFIQIFLVLFLTHQGFSSGQASLALGLYGAGAVVGTFIGGWLTDRITVRTVTLLSTVGAAILMVAMLY